MAFWAEGFWAPGFWASGFWAGMGGSTSTDANLQLLLDPNRDGKGIMIRRRVDAGMKVAYYVIPRHQYGGRSRWVLCNAADTDAQKYATIIDTVNDP